MNLSCFCWVNWSKFGFGVCVRKRRFRRFYRKQQ